MNSITKQLSKIEKMSGKLDQAKLDVLAQEMMKEIAKSKVTIGVGFHCGNISSQNFQSKSKNVKLSIVTDTRGTKSISLLVRNKRLAMPLVSNQSYCMKLGLVA